MGRYSRNTGIQYNATQINQGLTRNPSTHDFIVPLITHTKQAFYDASDTEKNVQNLYFALTGEELKLKDDD